MGFQATNVNYFDVDSGEGGTLGGFKKPRIAGRTTPWPRVPISVNRAKLSIPYKSELCLQHRKRRCYHGENCHFAHDLSEIRQPGPKTIAMVEHVSERNGVGRGRECHFFSSGGICPYGDKCHFLQKGGQNGGRDEAGFNRVSDGRHYDHKSIYHKTRLCARWEESFGSCPNGERCTYAHGVGELQPRGYYAELENGQASSQPRNAGSCKMGLETTKNLQMEGNVDSKKWNIARMAEIYADWIDVGLDFPDSSSDAES